MAKKQNVVGELPSVGRGRKKLAKNMLKESFEEAYPQETTETMSADEKSETAEKQEVENPDKEVVSSKESSVSKKPPEKQTQGKKRNQSTVSRKAKKQEQEQSNTESSPNEFTTLNCLKPTRERMNIVSAVLKIPIYKLIDDAVEDYITKQKKAGTITFDI